MRALILFLIWLPFAAVAENFPAFYDVVDVASDDVLNIRAEPNAGAPVIGALGPNEQGIEVVSLSTDGRWARLNSGESSGWVSVRYLARSAANTDGVPLAFSCYGTEPFWSFSRNGGTLTYTMMGETEMSLGIDTTLSNANLINRFALLASGSGATMTAIVKSQSCNDGMSDREFGLSVDLIHSVGGQTAFYSGCCSLNR